MIETQEPKYGTNRSHRIINRATKEAIPDDEPIFIFRGKDANAVRTLAYYHGLCCDAGQKEAVATRVDAFREFAKRNPDRMGEPK